MASKLFDDSISLHKFVQKCVLNSGSSESGSMQGWEGDSEDDSFLYGACTNLLDEKIEYNSDKDMFGDEEKQIVPETPSPESPNEVIEHSPDAPVDGVELDKETSVLKELLEDMGLRYNNVVTRNSSIMKGLTICEMSCQVNTKIKLEVKLARPDREQALIAAVKNITDQIKKKYFPEKVSVNDNLREFKKRLLEFCLEHKKPMPIYTKKLEGGMYRATVSVGEDEVSDDIAFDVLIEAEGSAAKLWLHLFGKTAKATVKKVPISEAFDLELDNGVTSEESVSRKELVTSKDTKRSAGFFEIVDNLNVSADVPPVSSSSVSEVFSGECLPPKSKIKAAFALLDEKSNKVGKKWSPRKEAAAIPRRSPRKQMTVNNLFQPTKQNQKLLMKEVFDDSSLSIASQEDTEEDDYETPSKRARSSSSDTKSAKKHKNGKLEKDEKVDFDEEVPLEALSEHPKNKQSSSRSSETKKKDSSSPKKKVGMFGKLSMKVDQEVKKDQPKFQFNQSIGEEKNTETPFTFKKQKTKSKDKDDPMKGKGKVEACTKSKRSNILEDATNKGEEKGSEEINDRNLKPLRSNSQKKKSVKLPADMETEISGDVRRTGMMTKKKSFGDVGEQDSPVKKIFKFAEKDKSTAQKNPKSKKPITKSKMTEEKSVEDPVEESKKSISSVFEFEDDPYVLQIMEKKKKEAEKLAARSRNKTKGRKRESMAKMAVFSQGLAGESSQGSDEDEGAKFKIPKQKKPRKVKKKAEDRSQRKINSFFSNGNGLEKTEKEEVEEAVDYTPSIDELLKIPDRPGDGGKTMDEVLDDLDKEIAERKKQHEAEMAKIDTDISAEKRRQEERRERLKRNAVFRDQLEKDITKPVLIKMFQDNLEYLQNIEAGKIASSRHTAFHKSCRTRHALYYTMITDPFTDNQLDWTLEELGKVWMRNRREQMDNNEYVWKVLLAECFIKFYMDHFNVDKKEAEKRISETPLRKSDDDSDESSDGEG